MSIDNLFDYFYEKQGQYLTTGENKKVLLENVRKIYILYDELVLTFNYKNKELWVSISKPKENLRLSFSKEFKGLMRITSTPIEFFDSTLLIYLNKFIECEDSKVEFNLFQWEDNK